jgi:colanic acid biosynthesis glycosyl transferase WcaI
MKRVLIITQYFPPEVGATQTRLYEMGQALLQNGISVDVFTSMPSYPKGRIFDQYRGRFMGKESINGINVHRVWSYACNELGVIKRLFSYGSFTTLAHLAYCKVRPAPDLIFVESPPLTLGLTGYLLSCLWNIPWILNVSDLWPDSIFALGGLKEASFAGKALCWLEQFLYKKADAITAVTEGIASDLKSKKNIPEKKILFLPNGVNLTLFKPQGDHSKDASNNKKIFLYAGRVGRAQGLDVLIRAANLTKSRTDIGYQIVGDGPELCTLNNLAREFLVKNLEFYEPVPLNEMPNVLGRAYCAVITLKNHPLFQGARPSKIMPALASGIPILYSGFGEGARLIQDINCGIVVPPEDERSLADAVIWLAEHEQEAIEMGARGREFAEKHYSWNVLVAHWLTEVEKKVLGRGIHA